MSSTQLRLVALADLRELDHRHPDRVAGDVAELEAAVDEALRDGACGRRARSRRRASSCARRRSTRRRPPSSASSRRSARRGRSRARPRPSARRGPRPRATAAPCRSAPMRPRAGDLELRQRGAVRADEHHVHRLPAAALLDEVALARGEDLLLGASRARSSRGTIQKPSVLMRTLSLHRVELVVALHGAGVVERDVPGHELGRAVRATVVAHRHRVVEPVDADPLAAHLVGEPLARAVDEDLLLDPRRAVLADVAWPRAGRRSPGRPRAGAGRRRSGARSRSPRGR